ncbi:MAG: c-type cytochrome [Fimbriimonadaceae bacterium]
MKKLLVALAGVSALLLAAGCHTDMWTQYKQSPLEPSDFFENRSSSRMPVPGTVATTNLKTNDPFFTGYSDGQLLDYIPAPIDEDAIRRGKILFNAFCSNCHGQIGNGQGMIAQRGFTLARPVPSFHTDRMREMPVGHFFDVQTNGFGAMYPLRTKITPEDRWNVAAYIRVLQLSQHATVSDATPAQRDELNNPKPFAGEKKSKDHGDDH